MVEIWAVRDSKTGLPIGFRRYHSRQEAQDIIDSMANSENLEPVRCDWEWEIYMERGYKQQRESKMGEEAP